MINMRVVEFENNTDIVCHGYKQYKKCKQFASFRGIHGNDKTGYSYCDSCIKNLFNRMMTKTEWENSIKLGKFVYRKCRNIHYLFNECQTTKDYGQVLDYKNEFEKLEKAKIQKLREEFDKEINCVCFSKIKKDYLIEKGNYIIKREEKDLKAKLKSFDMVKKEIDTLNKKGDK